MAERDSTEPGETVSQAPTVNPAGPREFVPGHRETRYNYRVPVILTEPPRPFPITGMVENLSRTGLRLQTDRTLRVDMDVVFDLPMTSGDPVPITGVVVWVRKRGQGGEEPGFGIVFRGIPATAKTRLRQLMDTLVPEPGSPDEVMLAYDFESDPQ